MPSKGSPDKNHHHKTHLGQTLHDVRLAEEKSLAAEESAEPDSLPVGESPLRKGISKSTVIKFVLLSLAIIVLLVYLAWDVIANGPLMQLLSNRDELILVMDKMGIWAPLLYISLQILQTVVAPIPGQVVGGVGGFLFGNWGILWTTIGSVIGFWLVFCIARRFGRPLLEKIFKKSLIDKFDFIINARGAAFIIFAIFLLPGFPDDVVCYIAGLTKLSIKKLMLISILGRFPTIVITNMIGAGLSENNIGLVTAIAVISVIILGIFAWQRERIISFMKQANPISRQKSIKSNETTSKPDTISQPHPPGTTSSPQESSRISPSHTKSKSNKPSVKQNSTSK